MSDTRTTAPARRRLRALAGAVTVAASLGGQSLVQQPATAAGDDLGDAFRVATFNVLGASHTEPGGNKAGRFDDYVVRMRKTIRLIDERGFDVVGLQEFQVEQYDLFMARTAGRWGVYPGLEAGRRPVQNSIVWRTDEWELVEKHLYTIPYFRGTPVQQPYIKLRHRTDGQLVWVINTHNPADSKGPAQQYRDEAMRIQVQLADELERSGLPVFLVGDFNDREEAFCTITGATQLKAAQGGSWVDGSCLTPRPMRIDWIFLSEPVKVSSYVELDGPFVRSITDHRVIYSDVAVPRRR